MKIARVFVALALLAAVAGVAAAQEGCYRYSWLPGTGTTCPTTQVADMTFGAAGPYYQGLCVTNVDIPNVGHDSNIIVGPDVPDCWRFDDLGCQTGAYLALSTNPISKSCPSMKGLNSLSITNFYYNPVSKNAEMRLALTYDDFDPAPATLYTLWRITYDQTYAVVGATTPGVDCGHAEVGQAFDVDFCQMLQTDGIANFLQPCPDDLRVTWQGGPIVPTQPSTWGKVKGLYR